MSTIAIPVKLATIPVEFGFAEVLATSDGIIVAVKTPTGTGQAAFRLTASNAMALSAILHLAGSLVQKNLDNPRHLT